MTPAEAFARLSQATTRTFSRPAEPPKPEPPSLEAQLYSGICRWASVPDDFCSLTFLPWLDNLIKQAELTENASLANDRLLLFNHGRVAALKELRGLILEAGRQV